MAGKTFKSGFMAGVGIGLAVALFVLYWHISVLDQYDTEVLATLPGTDPQVCYIAYVHKDHPAYDCATETPIVNERGTSSDGPTSGDVYAGSLAFAGLALFGSAILVQAFGIGKHDAWWQNLGSVLVISGTLFVVLLHVHFAFGFAGLPWEVVGWVTTGLAAMIVIGGGLVGTKPK